MAAMIDLRAVVGAKAERWVSESAHLAAVAERDTAEGLLVAAERRIAALERENARLLGLLADSVPTPLSF